MKKKKRLIFIKSTNTGDDSVCVVGEHYEAGMTLTSAMPSASEARGPLPAPDDERVSEPEAPFPPLCTYTHSLFYYGFKLSIFWGKKKKRWIFSKLIMVIIS